MRTGMGGYTNSQCMCNKENRDVVVTNCRKRGRRKEEAEECKRCSKEPAAACDGQM